MLITVGRKALFAVMVILLAWLLLFALRGAISPSLINQMNQEGAGNWPRPAALPLSTWSWDWSKSLWSDRSVGRIVGERLGGTLAIIGGTMLLSLLIALLFLFVGGLIARATERPAGLDKTRSVLRLVLISGAVSAPIFLWQILVSAFPPMWLGIPEESPFAFWLSALFVSALPVWLVVQYGHGEMSKMAAMPGGLSWRHLSARLFIRDLRLAGLFVVMIVLVGFAASPLDLGRQFANAVNRRDFPVIFGVAFAFVVIVVLFRLAADLAEIAYRYFAHQTRAVPAAEAPTGISRLPRWVPAVCLGLVAAALVIAVAAPLVAPYGPNERLLSERLSGPSPAHILGTDNLGRDVLSRLVLGIREDVLLALAAVGIMFLLAVGWSILAACARRSDDWQGDTMEDLVMLPRDVLYAFPWLVLLLLMVSFAVPDSGRGPASSLPVILAASLVLLPRAVGVLQEAPQSAPEGRSWRQGLLRALPVMALFAVAGGIVYVATASYLGLGVPPPTPELGGMLAGPVWAYMLQAPWMAVWPSVALILLLTVWVMAGESLLERFGFRTKAVWSKIWE